MILLKGELPNVPPAIMTPTKKGGEKNRECSAISEIVTREYTINLHRHIHGVGFKKCAPQALEEIWKFAMKEIGAPDVAWTPGSPKLSGPKV